MLGLGLALLEIECAQGLKVAARLSCKAVNGTVRHSTGVGIRVRVDNRSHEHEMLHFTLTSRLVARECVHSFFEERVYFETREVSSESAQKTPHRSRQLEQERKISRWKIRRLGRANVTRNYAGRLRLPPHRQVPFSGGVTVVHPLQRYEPSDAKSRATGGGAREQSRLVNRCRVSNCRWDHCRLAHSH